MSTPTYKYRDTLTGLISDATEDAASAFPDRLERVPDDAKPFQPGLFKPGKVGEFKAAEPLTDSQIASREALERVSAEHGPNSNAVKDAKAAVKEADDAAELAALEAAEADERARADAEALASAGDTTEGAQ